MTQPDSADEGGVGASVSVDDIISILDRPMRREVLEYFSRESTQQVELETLVDHIVEQRAESGDPIDEDQVAMRLHHVHLPKLAQIGVLEYDHKRRRLRYLPVDGLERFLEITRRQSNS